MREGRDRRRRARSASGIRRRAHGPQAIHVHAGRDRRRSARAGQRRGADRERRGRRRARGAGARRGRRGRPARPHRRLSRQPAGAHPAARLPRRRGQAAAAPPGQGQACRRTRHRDEPRRRGARCPRRGRCWSAPRRSISVDDALRIVARRRHLGHRLLRRARRASRWASSSCRSSPAPPRSVALAERYNAVAGKASAFGLLKARGRQHRSATSPRKALDGLYLMIGEEEKKIRADPVGTGSAILRKVFRL
ncbi:MAG: DUF4197 domain-containing protein [Comamonadaceae bacterium]|nr:DUF4197 domain-containing protein [Comamonadaceae bacterium]